MKNTFNVAHLRINKVLSTRNMFKEVKVPKSRGALGTGFTYAPVLWQSCGKPSTKFPHGGLVECLIIPHTFYLSLKKIANSKFLHIFLKFLIFSKFENFRDIMDLALALPFSPFVTFI